MKQKSNTDNHAQSTINPHASQEINPAPASAPQRSSQAAYQKLPLHLRPLLTYDQRDPIHYLSHLHPSMKQFAEFLVLRFPSPRTRHSYYRQIALLEKFCACDPASISESLYRDYLLFVRTKKHWQPKTIRQAAAAARLFFIEMLGFDEWKVFSQIRTKDHDTLPVVLTRDEVKKFLAHIRLRRYRIPLKLIYCCGLRLSECLSLTIHDICASEGKLWIRGGKGGKDRMVPISQIMIDDLRRYWAFHRHPLLLFPNAGRGDWDPRRTAERMHLAARPMPVSSLQRLMVEARKLLGLKKCTVHTLRHSFATHLVEAGVSLHALKALLGHAHIDTTMIYLHLTHRSEQDSRAMVEELCRDLPR